MKREIRNTVLVLSGVCAAVGIIMLASGFANGGSLFRALRNTELMPELELKINPRGTLPYGNGGYSDDYDDIYDFFDEFGLDDDIIEDFLNPYGGGASERNSSGGKKIY